MSWLPVQNETLVVPYSADRVIQLIQEATETLNPYVPLSAQDAERVRFNGVVRRGEFRLSRKLNRPNSFLPIISGKIAPTSKGCIVFLSYKMFTASLLFIGFWSLITLLIALYFILYEKLYGYGTAAIIIGIANYILSLISFHKQVKISSSLIKHTLQS